MPNENLISESFQGLISLSSPVAFVRIEPRVHQVCTGFLVPTSISRERTVYLGPYWRQKWLVPGVEKQDSLRNFPDISWELSGVPVWFFETECTAGISFRILVQPILIIACEWTLWVKKWMCCVNSCLLLEELHSIHSNSLLEKNPNKQNNLF